MGLGLSLQIKKIASILQKSGKNIQTLGSILSSSNNQLVSVYLCHNLSLMLWALIVIYCKNTRAASWFWFFHRKKAICEIKNTQQCAFQFDVDQCCPNHGQVSIQSSGPAMDKLQNNLMFVGPCNLKWTYMYISYTVILPIPDLECLVLPPVGVPVGILVGLSVEVSVVGLVGNVWSDWLPLS